MAESTGPVTAIVLIAGGVAAGLVLALIAYGEMLKVTVSNEGVQLARQKSDLEEAELAMAFPPTGTPGRPPTRMR